MKDFGRWGIKCRSWCNIIMINIQMINRVLNKMRRVFSNLSASNNNLIFFLIPAVFFDSQIMSYSLSFHPSILGLYPLSKLPVPTSTTSLTFMTSEGRTRDGLKTRGKLGKWPLTANHWPPITLGIWTILVNNVDVISYLATKLSVVTTLNVTIATNHLVVTSGCVVGKMIKKQVVVKLVSMTTTGPQQMEVPRPKPIYFILLFCFVFLLRLSLSLQLSVFFFVFFYFFAINNNMNWWCHVGWVNLLSCQYLCWANTRCKMIHKTFYVEKPKRKIKNLRIFSFIERKKNRWNSFQEFFLWQIFPNFTNRSNFPKIFFDKFSKFAEKSFLKNLLFHRSYDFQLEDLKTFKSFLSNHK